MAASETLPLGGEPMQLLADCALYWPRRERLLIADLHLGKGDAFRSAGIALPRGGTEDDLARLDAMLADTGASELMVLGDFLHGAAGDRPWRHRWQAWREARPALRVAVLAGNHDRALGGAGLDIELVGPVLDDGPFQLRHEPAISDGRHVLCGHLHPVLPLPGLPGRWPVFWLGATMTVLPAYSRFTGGVVPAPAPGDRFRACAHGELVAVQAAAIGRQPRP
ncbi:ligase-associated DNA damage response endonuclease PdeM [Arenimonas sp. MALMAid1274]|uniref:ligase-associated DNA damage response endonuclease PdeM n=1 Tax=Arenimonas sp. MALMAid1274 TaxID=3411630 RepID=UPI003BA10E9F